MGLSSLSGADTLTINNYVFSGLADQNWAELTFPNNIATVKIGKNQNAIFGFNAQGSLSDLKIRVLRGSADDALLLGILSQQQSNFSGFALMIGQFIKKVGDGQGNITSDIYTLGAGVILKQPEGKSNADGDTDQSVTLWELQFAQTVRVLS